jgi:hypothetical protein
MALVTANAFPTDVNVDAALDEMDRRLGGRQGVLMFVARVRHTSLPARSSWVRYILEALEDRYAEMDDAEIDSLAADVPAAKDQVYYQRDDSGNFVKTHRA